MTSLLHFEEKVHRKGLARAKVLLLLMLRLLSQVLEHLGFPEEPRIQRRIRCTQVLSIERSLYMPISVILQQQEEAADDAVEDPPRGEDPVPEMEVEVERSPVPDSSPPSPPPAAPAPTDTAGPSHISQQSPEHVHVSSRELAVVMDAVCALATTQASLDQRTPPCACLDMVPRPSVMTCLGKVPRHSASLDTVPRPSAIPSMGASA